MIRFIITLCTFFVLVTLTGGALSVCAQEQNLQQEYKIKAAFLLNFPKFIRWPQSDDLVDSIDFNVCLLGEDTFGYALSAIDGRPVKKQQVNLFYLRDLEQAKDCDMLFVSRSESERLDQIETALQKYPVLTVSDIPGFVDSEGIIEFVRQHDRVSFRINLKRAREVGFEINSSLLALAADVIQ